MKYLEPIARRETQATFHAYAMQTHKGPACMHQFVKSNGHAQSTDLPLGLLQGIHLLSEGNCVL